jgi:drug/metabolite transporter (DMT)-like permease
MTENSSRLDELRTSARGWHGVQLAVLGFIGLCGVLEHGGGEGNPRSLQIIAGVLIVLALVLSCAATALVASAAWPVYGSDPALPPAPGDAYATEVQRTGKRLRLGIGITFLAVAMTAVAATSSWWPREKAQSASVEVSTNGGVACGELRDATPGVLALDSDGRRVTVALSDVLQLRPVTACH